MIKLRPLIRCRPSRGSWSLSRRPYRVTLIASPLYYSPDYVASLLILLPFLLNFFDPSTSSIWRALLLLQVERRAEGVAIIHQAAVLQARLLLFLKSKSV